MLKNPRVIQDRKDQMAYTAKMKKQGYGNVGRPLKCPQDKGHVSRHTDGDTGYCAGCGRYTKTI